MLAHRTHRAAGRQLPDWKCWFAAALLAATSLGTVFAQIQPSRPPIANPGSGANAAASATEPAIVVPGEVRYSSQQSILLRYRWTGTAPAGVQMWISLDAVQWLPWAWSDKPAEPFAFSPPRQGKILIALAPADQQSATLPTSGYQSLAIVFDWDKPLLRLLSSEIVPAPMNTAALRLAWAAWDENLSDRPIGLHWRLSAAEPWQIALADLPNSGACEWTIPPPLVGKSFDICVRATDLAGNPAEAIATVEPRSKPAPATQRAALPSQAPSSTRPADPAVPTTAVAEAERLSDLAQQHINQNELDMAEDLFRQAVQADPTYNAARLNLGILLQRRSRHAEAIGEYQAVLAIRPDNVTAWRNLALAYMTIKDYPKARITLQKLLAVEADNPQTWIDLGDVEMLMGRSQTARQYWEKARSLSKPDSETAGRAAKRLSVYVREK